MVDWRTLKVNDKLTYTVDDFDGKGTFPATVTEVHQDHVVASVKEEYMEMNLWVDDFNADMFTRR